MTEGLIPTVGAYRGVPLHDQQDEARLADVRRDIDAVFLIARDRRRLLECVQNRRCAPEARLLAKALIVAEIDEYKAQRRAAPPVDLEWLEAVTAGLGTRRGRCPWSYDSRFASRPQLGSLNRPVRRPFPLR